MGSNKRRLAGNQKNQSMPPLRRMGGRPGTGEEGEKLMRNRGTMRLFVDEMWNKLEIRTIPIPIPTCYTEFTEVPTPISPSSFILPHL